MANPERLTWIGRTDSGVVRQRLYDRDIGTLLLSPLDPGRKAWDAAIRKEGAHTGRFIDPHWYGLAADGKALEFRKVCDAACLELQFPEMLMLDLELVTKDYVTRLLFGSAGNRGLVGSHNQAYTTGTQTGRTLGYTNMPFQNGTVVPIPDIEAAGLSWWPQLYYGSMEPADTAAVCLEIARWGFPSRDIHPFYDGKLIATDQRDGGWFTAERIPGVFASTSAIRTLSETGDAEWHARRKFTKDSLRASLHPASEGCLMASDVNPPQESHLGVARAEQRRLLVPIPTKRGVNNVTLVETSAQEDSYVRGETTSATHAIPPLERVVGDRAAPGGDASARTVGQGHHYARLEDPRACGGAVFPRRGMKSGSGSIAVANSAAKSGPGDSSRYERGT